MCKKVFWNFRTFSLVFPNADCKVADSNLTEGGFHFSMVLHCSEPFIVILLSSQYGLNTVERDAKSSYDRELARASNWYWLTVGQGLLSLQQVWVEGECLISSVSSLSFIFLFLPCPSLSSSQLSLLSSPFLWETTQNDPQGLTCR